MNAKIIDIEQNTKDTKIFTIKLENKFKFVSGQCIKLSIPDVEFSRPYSISSPGKETDEINLTIKRKGQIFNKLVVLSSRPSDEELYSSYQTENADFDLLGLKVLLSDEKQIIIKEVKKDSQAEEENIKPNDIITQIDDKPIENIEDYYDALANIQSGDIALIGVTTINKSKNFSRTYSRYVAIKVD